MATPFTTSPLVGSNIGSPSADATFSLGTEMLGTGNSNWVYGQAASAISQYRAVCIDQNGQAKNLTKTLVDAGNTVAIAQAAFASGEYGWFCRQGFDLSANIKVRVLASCAAGASLYTSATAGALDDSSTSQTEIIGIVIVTAASSSATDRSCIITTPLHARNI